MTFSAKGVYVLLASPSDTGEARRVLREAVEDWAALNGEQAGVVLLPLLWERDAVPEMGGSPQGILNRQLGDRAEMVIATFWTRLGTPTDDAESGSADEIRKAIEAGKPVMLYFSSTPVVPDNLDEDQFRRLREFRTEMEAKGLVDSYGDVAELYRKVSAALTRTVKTRFGGSIAEALPAPQGRAVLVARVEREPQVRQVGSSIMQTNNYHLVVENVGLAPAEDVRFHLVGDDSSKRLPEVLENDAPIRRLVPGNPLRFYLVVAMGMVGQFEVELTWREGTAEYTEIQTLRI